jgi:hypothetical protein
MLSSRWNGHDILSEVVDTIQQHRNETLGSTASPEALHNQLIQRLDNALRARRARIAIDSYSPS